MKIEPNAECPEPYILPDKVAMLVHETMQEDVGPLVSLFKVLSDPVRIHILRALEVSELCVCVLAEITDYKHSALSYHLKLLKDANMVESKRERNFQTYYLTDFGRSLLHTIERSISDRFQKEL
ncbi:ArsR/SmtB family transcription factor [Methanolobus chelungpuianus]|uniref:ArsR family transcriptional regulator n=1 Tax=Methanolobus chelungpuianus TaxID=502115 RepID=A0AAE3KXS7_9EURY|nr:metalloregulator ArsR/SmtB family transcription factor [Methanolobus chelungpuianus]MCQ6963171.1 ArsR family transcriptional regulator [Methanolobus chelungpuianus]